MWWFINYRPSQLFDYDVGWEILRGIFKHDRLKPVVIRTNHGNVHNLAELGQLMNTNLKIT